MTRWGASVPTKRARIRRPLAAPREIPPGILDFLLGRPFAPARSEGLLQTFRLSRGDLLRAYWRALTPSQQVEATRIAERGGRRQRSR